MARKLGLRILLIQALSISSAFASPFMLWKGVSLVANTESPVVVVLSESMEPAFSRGDLLFLSGNPSDQPYRTGDITVYKIPGQDIPIVHRVIEARDAPWGPDGLLHVNQGAPIDQMLLTKGDNNHVDDLSLYKGLEYLKKEHIVGKVWGFVPYVGYASIFLDGIKQLFRSPSVLS